MAEIVAVFFGIIGVSSVPPTTMVELIPYLLTVFVGVVLVVSVFRIIGSMIKAIINFGGTKP